jgi:hypothetical protein
LLFSIEYYTPKEAGGHIDWIAVSGSYESRYNVKTLVMPDLCEPPRIDREGNEYCETGTRISAAGLVTVNQYTSGRYEFEKNGQPRVYEIPERLTNTWTIKKRPD